LGMFAFQLPEAILLRCGYASAAGQMQAASVSQLLSLVQLSPAQPFAHRAGSGVKDPGGWFDAMLPRIIDQLVAQRAQIAFQKHLPKIEKRHPLCQLLIRGIPIKYRI